MTILTHSPCDAAIVRAAPAASPCNRRAEPWVMVVSALLALAAAVSAWLLIDRAAGQRTISTGAVNT